jgi:hypothetical protein
MDAVDRNFLRMSGRIRALEQLMIVMLIDWAERGDDPAKRLEAARRGTMMTLQLQERPIDEVTDFEVGAMFDSLDEIFANAKAHLQ